MSAEEAQKIDELSLQENAAPAEVILGEDGQPLSKKALKKLEKEKEKARKKAEREAQLAKEKADKEARPPMIPPRKTTANCP